MLSISRQLDESSRNHRVVAMTRFIADLKLIIQATVQKAIFV